MKQSSSHMQFDEKVFGSGDGDWSAEDRKSFAHLRVLYPELAHWGDLALGKAFGDYSQDFLEVSWPYWMLDKRDDSFLCFCYWNQVHGPWKFGMAEEVLEKEIAWKAWPLPPDSKSVNT